MAEDVRYYGEWMGEEAKKRIGYLYPPVEVTAQMAEERPDLMPLVGKKLTVIAWIWARTVKSPNPAFRNVDVPLVSTFVLSSKETHGAYVQTIIEHNTYRFSVKVGRPPENAKAGTKLGRGANFACTMSGTPISGDYIKSEGEAGRIGVRLMAIVAEGARGRVYISPTPDHEEIAKQASPSWRPEVLISGTTQYLGVKPYGMHRFDQIFSDRQLVALTTFADLVNESRALIRADAVAAGIPI
ncbi:hypothetical protein ACFTIK_27050, partial [Tistrella mobilis]